MTSNEIITAATEAGFTATTVDDIVEVTVSGVEAVTWRYNLIEAGSEYLGTVPAPTAPMGQPITSLPRTLRFRASC